MRLEILLQLQPHGIARAPLPLLERWQYGLREAATDQIVVLSQVLAMQGREVESRKELATAFVLNPNNDRVATDHALALGAEGQGAEARAVLRSVLRRNTTYGPAKAALDAKIDEVHSSRNFKDGPRACV